MTFVSSAISRPLSHCCFMLIAICSVCSTTIAFGESFSIKCEYQGLYYVTFDTASSNVVFESPAGTKMKGRIDKLTSETISFHLLLPGAENFDLILEGERRRLIWLGIPNNPARLTKTNECSESPLRPVLSTIDRI